MKKITYLFYLLIILSCDKKAECDLPIFKRDRIVSKNIDTPSKINLEILSDITGTYLVSKQFEDNDGNKFKSYNKINIFFDYNDKMFYFEKVGGFYDRNLTQKSLTTWYLSLEDIDNNSVVLTENSSSIFDEETLFVNIESKFNRNVFWIKI